MPNLTAHARPRTPRTALALLAAGLVVVPLVLARAGGQPAPAPANPAAAPGADPAADPGVDQTIRDLERQAPKREEIAPQTPPSVEPARPGVSVDPAGRPGAAGARLVREGTFLASRRGRMVRASSGEWVFAFDAGSASRAEPPMVLMPCQNLMAMERLAERGGEALTFTVSGQVFVYHGRNYLLPTIYVLNRRSDEMAR